MLEDARRVVRLTTTLDPVAGSRRPLLAIRIRTVGEKALQELVATPTNEVQQILHEDILVLVRHAGNVIHHVAGIVLDQELRTTGFEMRVTRKCRCTLDEGVVGGGRVRVCSRTRVVERGENPRRSTFLNEVAYNLVIEVLDWRPLDLLPDVLLLLGLQG